ncbi:MAG: acetylornithine/succinylornithine family transaminase [Clostridiales Family XIII bacterium]|jgi:acetylornithine/N-succinyldiaminopimelate aminotransferase|nr:acetylornithine/succinylornithine family transaminase [Clostridiales Family XIII bacterium]
MNSVEIREIEDRYTASTYNRYDVVLESGEGVYAKGADGKKYIDFTSGLGVNSLGYSDKGWVLAVTKQANKIQHASNLFYTEPCARVAEKICKLTEMEKAFFANSGAEANEGAIKAARKYSLLKYGGETGSDLSRYKIVTLEGSFHGRTMATTSATGQNASQKFFTPRTQGFGYAKVNDLESLNEAIDENTCAIMVEFIQGDGGVNDLSSEFVREIDRICKEKDVLLIADEVQTGIGRTGKFMSYEYFDIKPDIVSVAKGIGGGLPIGVVIFGEKTKDVFNPGEHGSTYGGNPVVCAGAEYVLSKFEDGTFIREIAKKGEYMRGKAEEMAGVLEVTGKGLMIGLDIGAVDAKKVVKLCLEKGLLTGAAKNKVRLLPPLIIEKPEIDAGLEILGEAIQNAAL